MIDRETGEVTDDDEQTPAERRKELVTYWIEICKRQLTDERSKQ